MTVRILTIAAVGTTKQLRRLRGLERQSYGEGGFFAFPAIVISAVSVYDGPVKCGAERLQAKERAFLSADSLRDFLLPVSSVRHPREINRKVGLGFRRSVAS